MKYFVTLGERTLEVIVDGDTLTIEGTAHHARIERVHGTPVCHLVLDGRSFEVTAEAGAPGEWRLRDAGDTVGVEVVDERTRHIRSLVGTGRNQTGAGPIKAPMPGLVLKLLVSPGQEVHAGQGLAVLEAMKMENEIKAPAAARVESVLVSAGQTVEKGQPLLTLAAPEPPA